jgi:hypothetical protein
MAEITVLNPVAELSAVATPRAPRLDSLDGVDFGLWWNKKIGGEVAVEFMGEELRRAHGVTPHRFYDSFPAHKGMTEKAAAASRAVVGATGD